MAVCSELEPRSCWGFPSSLRGVWVFMVHRGQEWKGLRWLCFSWSSCWSRGKAVGFGDAFLEPRPTRELRRKLLTFPLHFSQCWGKLVSSVELVWGKIRTRPRASGSACTLSHPYSVPRMELHSVFPSQLWDHPHAREPRECKKGLPK